jgi:DNA-binding MarR family transcriptional regulator
MVYIEIMVTNLAKRAMTTKGQRACLVIDHLVGALGSDPSSSLRRAMILADIDQYPGTTQAGIMERLMLDKSTVKREIDWLFDYGCIRMQGSETDGRSKKIEICGYSKTAFDAALGYFDGEHRLLKVFLDDMTVFLKQEKPTLRDAKIVFSLYERGDASKQVVMDDLYDGPASTDHRAYNKLREDGVITDA